MTEDKRTAIIAEFLRKCAIFEMPEWLPADASMRRYGRVSRAGEAAIVMDAPPHPSTKTREYIAISGLLRDLGICAAEIYAADPQRGVLLLQNLGTETFTSWLEIEPERGEELYTLAYEVLEVLQSKLQKNPEICPDFDGDVLKQELRVFRDWYCPAAGIVLTSQAWQEFDALVEDAHRQLKALPQRFVLRDCHVDNFIFRSDQQGLARCGVLDFQDGGWGCVLYDVTSLLFDARRDVPETLQKRLMQRHANFLHLDWVDYQRMASYLVFQRALKVLGVFVRLNVRDGKGQYIQHLSRCWQHVATALRHLPEWQQWFRDHLPWDYSHVEKFHPAFPVDTAMLLAAGKGTRMGKVARTTPKPLLPIAGKPLIEHTQETLRRQGITRFVVNGHHLSAQIERFFDGDEKTTVVLEEELLETGGGVRHALPWIGREIFWVINGDSLWKNATEKEWLKISSLFQKISQNIDFKTYHECAAALLLLVPLQNWRGAGGKPDFIFAQNTPHLLRRAGAQNTLAYGFSGVRLMNRAALAHMPIEHFSMNSVFDRLIAQNRLFGHVVDWTFFHVGDEAALQLANEHFAGKNHG